MMRNQRTDSSSLPAFLQHVGRRRNYRSLLIGGMMLLVLATFWLHDSIAIDGFGQRPPAPNHPLEKTHFEPAGQKPYAAISKPTTKSLSTTSRPAPSIAMARTSTTKRSQATTTSSSVTSHVSTHAPSQTSSTSVVSLTYSIAKTNITTNSTLSLIPPKIWQILLPKHTRKDKPPTNPKDIVTSRSWTSLNPNHTYTLLTQPPADFFVLTHFTHSNPSLVHLYNSLPNVGMKSDLLRYLLLLVHGGIYTDIDTIALRPISTWIPPSIPAHKVKLIVGIEFDRRDGVGWVDITHWVQLCQWTISAAPGHPVFGKMVERVQKSVQELSEAYRLPLGELKPTSYEVMNSTGPAAWTDVVFEILQGYDERLKDTKDLAFMKEPRLIGDVLVLPIDGFGMGQSHSKSTHDGTVPEGALVKHLFKGSWRGP